MSFEVAAREEFGHAIAAGLGLIECGVGRTEYNRLGAHVHVGLDSGEFAIVPPSERDDPELHRRVQRAQVLSGIGPLGYLGPEEVVRLAKAGDHLEIKRKAGLSAADLKLIKSWDGPPTTLLVVALGVHFATQRLGEANLRKMCRVLRDFTREKCGDWSMPDLFPFDEAERALRSAKNHVRGLMKPARREYGEHDSAAQRIWGNG